MLENPRSPRVRAVAKLDKRKAREETGLFLVEGPQAVSEALAFSAKNVVDLFATKNALERHGEVREAARSHSVSITTVSVNVLDAMADTVTPQGIVAVLKQRSVLLKDIVAKDPRLVVVCERVRDPGNLGAIIRAADAVGADGVVLTGRTVDPHNPKVVRATTGSLFHVPYARVDDLSEVIDQLRKAQLRVVAADVKGTDLLAARLEGALTSPTAWVFGNEAHGLEEEHLKAVDQVLKLPLYGRAESLNLATAASVCLYESAFAQRS